MIHSSAHPSTRNGFDNPLQTSWTLGQLLNEAGMDSSCPAAGADIPITSIAEDSRKVTPGALFVAVSGYAADGHCYVGKAVENGAAALLVERDVDVPAGIPVIRVPDSRKAIALLAHTFLGHPARDLFVFMVTGTNAKTTSCHLMRLCLEAAGLPTGIIGTIGNTIADVTLPSSNTTPSPLELAGLFQTMRTKGIRAVAMEASSHAIHQRRILGIRIDVALYTHLTRDHLDYHGTMEEYKKTKERLFSEYLAENPRGVGVFNMDDEAGQEFAAHFKGGKILYGSRPGLDVSLVDTRLRPSGSVITLDVQGERQTIETRLPGRFNVINITAAAASSLAAGIPNDVMVEALSGAVPVPGRFECVDMGQPFNVIVDYAHTPDALVRLLESVADFTPGRIITIFGAGGDRDKLKRPMMGAAVAKSMLRNNCDLAVITNDNPRSESPEEISRQILAGFDEFPGAASRCRVILDRREAIRDAIQQARPGDCVVIAGKGHENYQIIAGRVHHFDDRECAREILLELSGDE